MKIHWSRIVGTKNFHGEACFVLNRIALSPLISPLFFGCFLFLFILSPLSLPYCLISSSMFLLSSLSHFLLSLLVSLSLVLTLSVYFFCFVYLYYLITLSPLKSCLCKVSSYLNFFIHVSPPMSTVISFHPVFIISSLLFSSLCLLFSAPLLYLFSIHASLI